MRRGLTAIAVFGPVLLLALLTTGCGDDDPATPENRPPVISGLLADEIVVEPAGITVLTCTADDPDGDQLSYAWNATDGTFTGAGGTVSWIGPLEAGPCTVSVTVADGRGGSDSTATPVEVMGGTLLVQTDSGILAVDLAGETFVFHPGKRQIEVAGDRIFLDLSGASEIDHSGATINTVPRPPEGPSAYTGFAALPDGGIVFMENGGDTLTFVSAGGAFLGNVVMPQASPINQGLSGVVVGDRLIIAETGTQELVEVDLATRQAAVFRDFGHLGKWLNDVDFGSGRYYLTRSGELYGFTETGDAGLLFDGGGLMLGLAVVGKYVYCTDRTAGAVYRVDTITGDDVILVDGLDDPRDIEFLPVALAAPQASTLPDEDHP